MSTWQEFKQALEPIHQAIIGIESGKIVFANPAALSALGKDLCERKPNEIFPEYILDTPSERFVATAEICKKNSSVDVSRIGDLSLYFIDFMDTRPTPITLNRSMLSYLRSCTAGIKMAADRCFDEIGDSFVADDRLISSLYHYYYRLARIIIQLDCADKLEHGDMVFSPAPTDLSKLCEELASTLSSISRENVKINFEPSTTKIVAVIDSGLIELTLLNLFSNSMKNSKDGRVISFALKETQGKAIINIDDNGAGIPAEKLSRIFSLADYEESKSIPKDGLGLGMFIAHSIVRLHNGVMLLESKPDEGVRIRILLPTLGDTATMLNSPESEYRTEGMSPVLTALADVLSSDFYGRRFED